VLADLVLDWQGGRQQHLGFDQILRETDAGREWREALLRALETADGRTASTRLTQQSADFAGRAESWAMATLDAVPGELAFMSGATVVTLDRSAVPGALGYRGTNGQWLACWRHERRGRVAPYE